MKIILIRLFLFLSIALPAFGYRDPETGAFLTADPAGDVDGPNLYTYVRQNPWTSFDPEGLQTGGSNSGNQQLLREMDDEFAQKVTRASDQRAAVTNNIVEVANCIASLNPVQNAITAGSGKDALGQSVSKFDQGMAVLSVVAGPAEKLVGKLLKEAKALLKLEKTAADTVKEAAQLAKNAEQGKAAEQLVGKQLAEEGQNVVGSRVTVNTPEGKRVLDHLVETEGELVNVEVKSGGATRNATQKAKDKAMAAQGGTVVGKNAPADLRGKTVNIQTEERHVQTEELK